MARKNDAIKATVLSAIGHGATWRREGESKFRIGKSVVHARFKTSAPFSFNINPATLRADYELWVCGAADRYYLLTADTVREMYRSPGAYVDGHHSEIRVVSVNTRTHRATFARGGVSLDVRPAFQAALPPAAV